MSFAGEQRQSVEDVGRGLDLPKGRVFYDADYKAPIEGVSTISRNNCQASAETLSGISRKRIVKHQPR